MLALCVTFLGVLYVAKIFYPQEFVMSIENERVIAVGKYIDTHEWLLYLCSGVTAFITYYLYCCACAHKLYLKWQEVLMVVGVVVVSRLINFFNANLALGLSNTAFLFLPFLMKGDFKSTTIAFTIHSFSQILSLSIRNLPIYLISVDFATMFILGCESYLWLVLLYAIFNYKDKKEV